MEKKQSKRVFSCLLLLLLAIQMMAQGNKITMKCVQMPLPSALSYGQPLVGVSVKVMGSKLGTVTDENGEYAMSDIPQNAMLEYSYLGMKPFQRKASYKHVTIIMEDDSRQLNDVVVTGYQTLKKENATGSFQVISSKDINDRYLSNLQQSLEGKVAGLVNYDNGNSSGLTIRGVGTLKANSSPLIVVDGLPISGTLDDVNKYEVDKITVLKDAAAIQPVYPH